MGSAPRIALASVLVAGIAAGAGAGVAAGKSTTISGKIKGASLANARVVALGVASGAISVKAKAGTFRITLPSSFTKKGASLHIVRANGMYVGPIVLARKARKGSGTSENQAGGIGYEGLSGSVGNLVLGNITVSGGAGSPSATVPTGSVDTSTGVPLRPNGRPLGAGELGMVDSPTTSTDVSQGGDPDRDGIANAFDVDVNGNGVLNAQDAATTGALASRFHPFLFSSLFVPYAQATSSNAAAFDTNVQQFLTVNFGVAGSGATTLPSVSVDCQGVPWCATATLQSSGYGYPLGTPWPVDAAGFHVVGHRLGGADWDIGLLPNQPTTGLAVGSVFRFILGTKTAALTLGPYFQAPPVLIQMGATPLGDNRPPSISVTRTAVTMTLQRPLRTPVPGAETGTAISMGTLKYGVIIQEPPASTPGRPVYCPASAYSGLSATLSRTGDTVAYPMPYGVADSAPDALPGPGRVISFTVDLTACTNGAGRVPAAAPVTSLNIGVFAWDAAGNNVSTSTIPLTLQ